MNMEEFEDFMEYESQQIDPKMEAHLEKMKDRLARANFEALVTYGIDARNTRNKEAIIEIIKETMQYFEELEEYEKCAALKRFLDLL